MINFENSIKAGIEAANLADENLKEIHEVFEDLSRQVEAFSNGKLVVKLEKSQATWGNRNTFFNAALGAAVSATLGASLSKGSDTPSDVKKTTRLVLSRKSDSSPYKASLATVELSSVGYPVKFEYADQTSTAGDKVSLELLLSSIFEHPDTGKIVLRMMQQTVADDSGTQTPP